MSNTFYLHEDEWGMLELLPIENLAERKEVAQEARRFGDEHRDGTGWTDIYVIPEPQHSIAERHIPLTELRALVGSWSPEAEVVQSGYTGYAETLQHSFAFRGTDWRSGAFYGNYEGEGGIITQFNILRPNEEEEAAIAQFAAALVALGERHSLMLADWWSDVAIDLRNRAAVTSYLRASSVEG